MFTNILKYTTVICLTFSSMVQMSVLPVVTIIDEMREELSNCSFPPAEVLKQSSQGSLVSSCASTKPLFVDEKPSANDLKFFFLKYLCMELFDLSLQLCNKKISEEFPTSEESFEKISLGQDVTTFCEKLQFPRSRAKKTSQWAGIAVDTLKNRSLCESQCISQNSLHPLCGAISWASKLLITHSEKQKTLDKPGTQAHATVVTLNQELDTRDLKSEAANTHDVKDEVSTKTLDAESKVNGIGGPQSTDEGPKIEDADAGGQTVDKHSSEVSPTQLTTATSTVTSVLAEVTRDIEKDDDHEEDFNNHSPRIGLADSDDTVSPADELEKKVPKGSSADNFSQEGDADEDAQSRGNSANGLPYDSRVYHDTFVDTQDSHFFAYFLTMVVICIVGYLVFHNKQKIIALALEGRRMQGSRRRPNTSSYKKLDSNLEEAVTSACSSSSVTHVVF